ncbi:hypothetical protein [Lewinella sp. JB7]|uniref:plasmid mobilization protein n=1 Tax=Lewinella sp. JB7 TaxID=2962887 RepID=UPI0020C9D968|nr:hypothetical protein [Lewinella sp. JB7]MCP9237906.1 hypothetical protein [Lewinella sp. JB7]
MARPRLNKTDKLGKTLPAARCSEAEYVNIRERADEAGLSLSAYIRQAALFDGEIVVQQSPPKINADIIYELNKVGHNFNQITRIANTFGFIPSELQQVCDKLDAVLDRILDLTSGPS